MTLEEIVNSLKSAGQDYGQLLNNNPKYTAVASNVTKGLENLVPPQFTNTQDAKSQEYSKKIAEWALGNGMGMSGMALATKISNPIKDNLNAKLVQKYLSTGKLSPDEMTMYDFDNILFNGSSSPINKILPKNELEKKGIYTLFDGVFSHPDINIASSHGDIINRFVPRKNAIAQGSLDWNHEYDDILKEIKQMYPHASDADIEEVLYPAIVDDKNIWNMDEDLVSSATGKYDMADASWDMQNSRGKLANKLGYDAVGMNDEHGTSYLIPHGSKALIVDKNLNLINNNQKSLIDLLGKK